VNEKQRAKWDRIRTRGPLIFVVTRGVLWGAYMTIALTVVDRLWGSRSYHLEFIHWRLMIFVLGGFLGAVTAWFRNEWKYEMTKKREVDG
jgi:hypothetical protein